MRSTVDHIIKDLFQDLQTVPLNDSQLNLVTSMKQSYQKHKKLSEKQLSILLDLKKYSV